MTSMYALAIECYSNQHHVARLRICDDSYLKRHSMTPFGSTPRHLANSSATRDTRWRRLSVMMFRSVMTHMMFSIFPLKFLEFILHTALELFTDTSNSVEKSSFTLFAIASVLLRGRGV